MTPDRAKFNKEVEKGLLDSGVNTPIRPMTKQETAEQRIKIQADQIASLKRQIGRLETQLANELLLVNDGSPLTPHGEAIAAGDGTLHGAIDYWQQQAFTLAAGQCCVESGGLMADDHGHQYCDMERQRDELRERAQRAEADAERGRYMIANAAWHRSDDHDGRYASMVIQLPYEADLSCCATREAAIDAAMKEGK